MITLIKYLIKQKLLINLLIVFVIFAGSMSLMSLNREGFPEVSFDQVAITTVYPGGTPDELEQLVSIPIEKKLREIDGIDKVRSYNVENVSVVVVFIDDTYPEKDQVVDDIKDIIEQLEDLPETALKPLVKEIKSDKTEVVYTAVYPKKDNVCYGTLREVADDLEDYIYDIEGVAEVEAFNFRDIEYLVEVYPQALQKYRIGMNDIISSISCRSLDFPGGPLRIGEEEFVLRTKGKYRNTHDLRNTVIMANDSGYVTRVRDIGRVYDTFEEAEVIDRYNGREAIIFAVWKKDSADEIRTAERIYAKMEHFNNIHSDEVEIEIFNDKSQDTISDIRSVLVNAVTGFILLALILFVALGMRMSTLITLSIPLSFMVAFIGMNIFGVTINVMSLFALIMVLGMIVDFSIVVSENSHRYIEMGMTKYKAVKKGVSEMVWPVTVTFICICAAFAPLLFLTGLTGKFIRSIPVVLMICLGASWFIAFFILPSFLEKFSTERGMAADEAEVCDTGNHSNFVESELNELKNEKGIFGKILSVYHFLLQKSLDYRFLTLGLLIMLLVGCLAMVPKIGFVFIPGGGSEEIQIKTYLPQSKNLQANLKQVKTIEKIILSLPEEELKSLRCRVGEETPFGLDPNPGEGTHKSTIDIYLTHEKDRKRTADDIAVWLRNEFTRARTKGFLSKQIVTRIEVKEDGPPIGKPINIEIRGENFATIEKMADEYIAYLKKIDGVYDVTMDLEKGKQEYRYKIKEEVAAMAGVSVRDIAQAINASYEGAIATNFKLDDEDISIRVRFPDRERTRVKSLEKVFVANRAGGLVPLSMVTSVVKKPGYSEISRLNYRRLVQVQAYVDTDKITSMAVNSMLARDFSDIAKNYKGYEVAYGGEQEDTADSMKRMASLFLVALMVIYIVLAVYFNSLSQPMIIMSAIPFSLLGVIIALFTHGESMCFMTVLGIFSLAGVIVSNTLVLVEFINRNISEGLDLKDALVTAGLTRLRPVFLTTGTTVLGLIPTIYGIGDKNYFVAPLALAFGYGLIFASFITLILVPCLYHINEDLKLAGVTLKSFMKDRVLIPVFRKEDFEN